MMAPNPFLDKPDAADIQGDILLDGLPKIAELFCFFKIKNAANFRAKLPAFTDKFVTTVKQQQAEREALMKLKQSTPGNLRDTGAVKALGFVNISFSKAGLDKLQTDGSLTQNLDRHFSNGMQQDALLLKDPAKKTNREQSVQEKDYVPDWAPAFVNLDRNRTWTKQIIFDGLILIAGSGEKIEARLKEITAIGGTTQGSLEDTIEIVKVLRGKERDNPALRKHEHFGFLDGVSEPWVTDVDVQESNAHGQRDQIKIGDIVVKKEDSWMNNGSYVVFRYLVQKVPEFQQFCAKQADTFKIQPVTFAKGDCRLPKDKDGNPVPGPLTVPAKDVLAARMVGRWPNGVAITQDTSVADADETFKIDFGGPATNVCPFAAHIRKTGPRDGSSHHIMRRGIQFGDELRAGETTSSDFLDATQFLDYSKEKNFRGLLFACYQSDIHNRFFFMQNLWCNNEDFPFDEGCTKGIDPLIGQVNPLPGRSSKTVTIAGMKDPTAGRANLDPMPFVNELILPAGGEYFFAPSVKALKGALATGKAQG